MYREWKLCWNKAQMSQLSLTLKIDRAYTFCVPSLIKYSPWFSLRLDHTLSPMHDHCHSESEFFMQLDMLFDW